MKKNYFQFCFLLVVVLIPFVTGCSSGPIPIIVSFESELQVVGTRADGSAWKARPEEISRTVRSPAELDPFGNSVFQGPAYRVAFGLVKKQIGMQLGATGSQEVCFRLDEARLASPFYTGSVTFGSFPPRLSSDILGKMREKEYREYHSRWLAESRQPKSKVCFKPGEEETFRSLTDMKVFFPSGYLFNVSHPESVAKLDADGIGSSVKLRIPVEVGGKREEVEFTLIARRSYAREAHY